MFRLDADKPVEFCDGLRRRDFLHAGSLSVLGLGLTQLLGLKALGAVDNAKKDVNCILLMLVGGPVAARHLGHEAERAGRNSRPVQTHQDQRPGDRDLREFPAHGQTRRQVLAHPQRLSHRRRRPRYRPPDDADRPPVPGRHRISAHRLRAHQAARAARATCRRTCSCRTPSATPAATCRTARPPASSARATIRSC